MSHRIKICYIISSLAKQGPVQVLLDIVKYINFQEFEITIITLKKEGKNSLINDFERLPIKIIKIENIHRINIFRLYKILRTHIINNGKSKFNILHSHCSRSQFLCLLFKKKSIHINTIHNGKLFGGVPYFVTKFLIKKTQYSIACSKTIADELFKHDKIAVNYILNGVSPLDHPHTPKEELRKCLNLKKGVIYFISVGRFSMEKNFKVLIELFLKNKCENVKLIILGDGPFYQEMKKNQNEKILLPGFKSNVIDYLLACDYYISTSLTEGMPLSVLEAMSVGLPLLLSNIPAHKEIFSQTEVVKIGSLLNLCDTSNDPKVIKSIFNEDYENLNKNVVKVYNKHFTAERMSQEYQEYYKMVALKK